MKILFTRSPNVVDWLIKLATGEDCGHMALLFEGRGGSGVVFESNLLGAHPAFYKTWMRGGRTIVHSIDVPLSQIEEDHVWDRWVEEFDGRGYDFGGALYLGLMKARYRLFGTPLPARNRWAKRRAFFCDEVFQVLSEIPRMPKMDIRTNGMSTPHDVYRTLEWWQLAGQR